ncbi:hypothetical protein [Flammeovirga aprica]|uniref:DUF1837 domain-containing protein n=1 Tax=Flammeovirga aprica JL-4 TaxID=694437 RepID=A0A7X9P272_9BACT|nr:hypothetical protein [Flammeovirga aprica]NME68199.1 hypothetical protein [Flammeovirga aprica JL-4]
MIKDLEDKIYEELIFLSDKLTCVEEASTTHKIVKVTGWEVSNDIKKSIATYFVGLRALAIDELFQIRMQMWEETPEDVNRLKCFVTDIIGETTTSLSIEQKQDERNPWLSEALWHLCFYLASDCEKDEFHPPGKIISINSPHLNAKDHGMDVYAIFKDINDELGFTIVETKAYKRDPNQAIQKANTFFKKVENGNYDLEIRQYVQAQRSRLKNKYNLDLNKAFWQDNKVYIPNPHYDSSVVINWQNKRSSFESLEVDLERKIIMPNSLNNFDTFFDDISEHMRQIINSL